MSKQNLKGILCKDSVTNEYFFREYDPKYKEGFRDYKILHNDLEIKIIDTDIYIGQNKKGEYYIDHSLETLYGETKNETKTS